MFFINYRGNNPLTLPLSPKFGGEGKVSGI